MEKQQKGRVIITSARNIMALVIARSLGSKGIEVIAADCISFTMLAYSKYVSHHEEYTSYEENEKQFLDDLELIIKKHKPDDGRPFLLIPVFRETMIISKNAERFLPHIKVATPPFSAVEKVHPKDNLFKTAISHGVNIPETYLPEKESDLEEITGNHPFPLITKPYAGTGGRGIHKVETKQELIDAFEENKNNFGSPPLVQEFVDQDEYCLTTLFDDGKVKAAMAYKNILEFPQGEGSGVVRENADVDLFIGEALKLMKPIRWNGIAQIDFLWDGNKETKPKLLEVNPRFWAGLYQSVQSGVDFPWLIYKLFTDRLPDHVHKPKYDTKTKLPLVWIASIMQDSININDTLSGLKDAGEKAFNEFRSDKNLSDAFDTFLNETKSRVKAPFNKDKFKQKWRNSRNAENEIFSQEDPGASIGIAYALAYWIKYKKLPPEAKP